MTATFPARVERRPYTLVPITTATEVVTMADVSGAGASGASALQAPIVFVVDDDISVRESLELLITSAGWCPETYASAQDFLSRPRVGVPCCVVLDVRIPGLSGLDLQQQLAARPDMPIIFITGYGDVPMSVRAMKAGATEF